MTSSSPPGTGRLEIVRVEPQHAELVAAFIRQVWDPHATADSVLASRRKEAEHNHAEPGVAPPTWIAVQEGKALGYVTTLPIRLWDGVAEWPAYWIKGLMVLPEFQGGPIGYLLVKQAAASLPRTGALAVARPALRLFQAVGYQDLGAVPNWVRPLNIGRMLQRLDLAQLGMSSKPVLVSALGLARRTGLAAITGGVAGTLLRNTAAARRLVSSSLETSPFDARKSGHELDALWTAVRNGYGSSVVRDAAYLIHRFPTGAASVYSWLCVRQRGKLLGVAILRSPSENRDERLNGIRVATIADMLFHPQHTPIGLALLGVAERAARSYGADAILVSSPAHEMHALLRKQFYFATSGNVHLLVRDVADEDAALARNLEPWWIMRGDGQADEAF